MCSKYLLEKKEDIIEAWGNSPAFCGFSTKLSVTDEEKNTYLHYFGNKILHFLGDHIHDEGYKNEVYKYYFFTTKFFAFIQNKNIEIEDLLEIVAQLKEETLQIVSASPDVEIKNFLARIHSIFDAIFIAITKSYNETIRVLMKQYKIAIEESAIIVRYDIFGVVTYVNDQYENLLGFTPAEIVGHHFMKGVNPSEQGKVDYLWRYVNERKIWRGIVCNKSKDGKICWTQTTIVPIMDSHGKILEFIAIKFDVTELKELDEKKTEFVNIASHELRTPLTAIKGYLSMIIEGDTWEIPTLTKQSVEKVYGSTNRLIALINDMLDVAKLEAGKMEFTLQELEMHAFLREIADEYHMVAKEKGQSLDFLVDFDHFLYNTDRDKLKQVLINILGNAIKFTPQKGKITIGASIDTKNECFRIFVRDSGIGIKKEDISTIFEKFGQIKNSLTRDHVGTGLWLSIVRAVVERLWWKVEVESEVGQGSMFAIRLPLTPTLINP